MKKVIIYGSNYGTTKAYALKLSEMTDVPVVNYEDVKDLSGYDVVIHLGGLYAGGVKGLKNTVKLLPDKAKFIIVTVGLVDVSNKENTDHIKKTIGMQVPKTILESAQVLHLRGGIDYSKLSFMHKTMMSLVYKKAKSTPEEQMTPELRDMIDTYGKVVDFVDFESLGQVVEAMTQ